MGAQDVLDKLNSLNNPDGTARKRAVGGSFPYLLLLHKKK